MTALPGSLLDRAIRRQRRLFGKASPNYAKLLGMLGDADGFGPALNRIVSSTRRDERFAAELVHEVVMLAMEAHLGKQAVEMRSSIADRYKKIFQALSVLEEKYFDFETRVRIVEQGSIPVDPAPQSRTASEPAHSPGDTPYLRRAIDLVVAAKATGSVPLEMLDDPDIGEFALRWKVDLEAPGQLKRMRQACEADMAASLANIDRFPRSRRRGDPDVDRRTFVILLSDHLGATVFRPCDDFTTAAAAALFPSDTVLSVEGTRALRDRESARRRAAGRQRAARGS